jgi:hypothetical protein
MGQVGINRLRVPVQREHCWLIDLNPSEQAKARCFGILLAQIQTYLTVKLGFESGQKIFTVRFDVNTSRWKCIKVCGAKLSCVHLQSLGSKVFAKSTKAR